MIKKPSNRKNFRQKAIEDDEADTRDSKTVTGPTIAKVNASISSNPKSNTKSNQNSQMSKLSFGQDEDEGDVFVVKKSNESKKLAKLYKLEKEKAHKDRTEKYVKKNKSNIIQQQQAFVEKEIKLDLSNSGIPDAATIHALKKQREMKRQFGSDYLPVDDTVKYGGEQSTDSGSRLIRDDENDKSDPEEDYRQLSFSNIKNTSTFGDSASIELTQVEEEDEEVSRWEQEQIKKGSSASQAIPAPSQSTLQPNVIGSNATSMQNTVSVAKAVVISPSHSVVTIDQLKLKMKQKLQAVQEVHSGHSRELERVTSYLEGSEANTVTAEQELADASNRFTFFQDMRQYIDDLLECFNEKITVIGECEESLKSVLVNKAKHIVTRRLNDMKDEDSEYVCGNENLEHKVDEFGRDRKMFVDNAKQKRADDRYARRKHRRTLIKNGSSFNASTYHEGLSTDDEITDEEELKYEAEIKKIREKASTVFADVIEEYFNTRIIMKKFEKWKFSFPDKYKDAYIPLCLPKLFSPIVRLQLLDWNLFEHNSKDIETLPWYQHLMLYGSQNSDDFDPEDPDLILVPVIVEKTVLPKLKWTVEELWDPLSSHQTNKLISLMKGLLEEYPTVSADKKSTQEICSAAVTRMKRCMNDEMYIPLYQKAKLSNSPGAKSFALRQLWRCVKLYGNVFRWYNIISTNILEEIAIDGLLNRYIVIAMKTYSEYQECIIVCEEIVKKLPSGILEEGSLLQFALFTQFLVNLVKELRRKIDESAKFVQNDIRRIGLILKTIKENDELARLGIK